MPCNPFQEVVSGAVRMGWSQRLLAVVTASLWACASQPAVPADLEALIMGCLEKLPAKRPASASALAESLRACRDFRGWTDEQAHGWWSRHAEAVAEMRRSSEPHPDQTTLDGPGHPGRLTVKVHRP